MKIVNRIITYGIIVLMFLTTRSLSQEGPLPPGVAAERIEHYKKIRLIEELKLDEDISIKFFARYNKYHNDLKQINDRKNEIIDHLDILRRETSTDSELEKVFKELIALDNKLSERRISYLAELKEVLTPKQVAQYVVFERNFYRDLRQIIRETQRGRFGFPRR
jgi:Spy/CpxP family protein refolding chaperone